MGVTKKPELVNCVAKQPPKKDDGQSPLQVALKTGNFEIAKYLIDMGADLFYSICLFFTLYYKYQHLYCLPPYNRDLADFGRNVKIYVRLNMIG